MKVEEGTTVRLGNSLISKMESRSIKSLLLATLCGFTTT